MPTPTAGRPEIDLPEKARYTYDDYQQLPEGAPYELVNGHLVMSPSPSVQHQRLVFHLGSDLSASVQATDEGGEVLLAPMDVHLSENTVVQPDILYVSPGRSDRIEEQEINGAPDLVIEVASPYTSHLDAFDKKQLYEAHGVREYWIVDPDTETVEVYQNTDDGYRQHARAVGEGRVASEILDDFAVILDDLF
jgi:Uma2 family endonuclease